MTATPKLPEIAQRINAHLQRLEADDDWNKKTRTDRDGTEAEYSALYIARAHYSSGPKISIVYISYQGQCSLNRAEAMAYLEWLDAGGKGRHYEQQREARV